MATHEIRIDRSRTLLEEPDTGHNRWHPDIPPLVRCEPGDEVVLETRDAFDGQMGPDATLETVAAPTWTSCTRSPARSTSRAPSPATCSRSRSSTSSRTATATPCRCRGSASCATCSPTRSWSLGHRRRLGDLGRPARRTHPRRAVHGHHRPVPGTELLRRITAREQARSTAAASSCRRRRRPPCRPTRRSRRRRCAPSRRGSRPAMSTSSSSAPAPGCSSRSTPRARCSPPATRTSPRATARPAARRSR